MTVSYLIGAKINGHNEPHGATGPGIKDRMRGRAYNGNERGGASDWYHPGGGYWYSSGAISLICSYFWFIFSVLWWRLGVVSLFLGSVERF